ncbi:putative tricarboxylic transport membrane protein [Rhodobacter sp. JA431]|uniref:tripartite tricarboxylate transporter TctB family protein n=1 Tax=Rhodobacter sp. JA431 TaxID=570013 RepID=UPI000BD98CFF|nr:tripartite tricarboxylate transporter TctB family protein [Rhodobacter sp. JA431]SOB91393.1 putative tricarboxylic transport membrane protein [Rhodobacter sp. JA431]
MSDRIFGAFGLMLAIFFAWGTLQIQESFLSDTVGPKTFPLLIASLLGLSSFAILVRPGPEPVWPSLGRFVEILAAVVVMVLYVEALDMLGFVFATTLATTYLSWRLQSPLWQAGLVGVGTAVGIYVIFHLLLGLSLARGPFGF